MTHNYKVTPKGKIKFLSLSKIVNFSYICNNKTYFFMKTFRYKEPKMSVISLTIERGFATSLENPETNPEIDW